MSSLSRREFLLGGAAAAGLVGAGYLGDGTARAAIPSPSERAAMAAVVANFMAYWSVPGMAVAIFRHGRPVFNEGFGIANPATRESVTADHLFRIASVTKPLTATAIFTLIERGKLRLSDRVFGLGGILGNDYGAPPNGTYVEDIVIDHLLTHSCGGWGNDSNDPMFQNPEMDHTELIRWTLANLSLTDPPGTRYRYSNFGFCLLGRVIEKLTNLPYAEFMTQDILRRCGIDRMRIAGNTLAERVPLEVTYHDQNGGDPYGMNVRRMDSHGGWLARPIDLVRFLMHVDGFPSPPDILSPRTIATMTADSGLGANYARGWNVNSAGNWWHLGSLPGSSTVIVRTSSGFCWAALTNTRRMGPDIGPALDKIMWDVIGQVNWPD